MGHQSMGRKCMERQNISKHLRENTCEKMYLVSEKKITFPSKDICIKLSIEYTSDEQCDFLQP